MTGEGRGGKGRGTKGASSDLVRHGVVGDDQVRDRVPQQRVEIALLPLRVEFKREDRAVLVLK